MSAKEFWDTLDPHRRQQHFPQFNPAAYGARWVDLTHIEMCEVYRFKEGIKTKGK